MNIAYKEARESHYWLRLLIEINYLKNLKELEQLKEDAQELKRILASIVKNS